MVGRVGFVGHAKYKAWGRGCLRWFLLDVGEEHGNAESFVLGFAFEQGLLAPGIAAPIAQVLGECVRQETGAQIQRVLAVAPC